MGNPTDNAPSLEVRVYQPSGNLMTLVENVKRVAKFDPGIVQVFEQATKINAVNQLMAMPEMSAILDKLEGNPAGFQTDLSKDGKFYDVKVRNMAVTQALSLGGRLVNKEFVIIKGNAMMAKNYYRRMLEELGHPETFLANCNYKMLWFDTIISEIRVNGPVGTADTETTYKVVDKRTGEQIEKTFKRTFQIRVNSTDGPDLWVGKMERRAWQKLLQYLSGVDLGDGEEGDGGGQGATPPPVGTVNLAKEVAPKPEKAHPAVSDGQFTEIVKGQAGSVPAGGGVSAAPSAPTEATSKTQKAYAEMGPEERKAETAKANAAQAPAPAQEAPAQAAPAAAPSGKPELF